MNNRTKNKKTLNVKLLHIINIKKHKTLIEWLNMIMNCVMICAKCALKVSVKEFLM